MTPEVRPARPADEAALRLLHRRTWSPKVSPGLAPAPAAPFFSDRIVPEDVLVAVVDGTVVGYAQLGPDTALASNAHVLHIHGLAVDPARRGRGLGRALVEAAVTEARGRGARRLTLRVLAPNEAARRLYRARGFVEEGVLREEFLIDGGYVDDVLMALDVS